MSFKIVVSQDKCFEVFSAIDSSFVKGAQVFATESKVQLITDSKGYVCFAKDTSTSFLITKTGYYSSTVSFSSNGAKKVYILPNQINLNTFIVTDEIKENELKPTYLRKVEKMFLYHGKKTEKIEVSDKDANLATNNTRQIYKNIAGLNYIETSSSGLGTEIGVRGLSPERSSNLNIRQNGYDISADALGYPDAYYVPPSQGVETIESVRGAGALQYGTQFGGMINYRMKKAPLNLRGIGAEFNQTYGSYRFINTFNSVYGRNTKGSFYAFFGYKQGEDWKPNSAFNAKNVFVQGDYRLTTKLEMGLEFTHFYYLAQQPGGLTDAMFAKDPTVSIRDRNWFSVSWSLPSIRFSYRYSPTTEIESKFFGLLANRKALGFLGNITRVDPLGNRDYLLDRYLNIGNETKFLKRYTFKEKVNILLVGVRFYRGNTQKQQGEANDGYGPDFAYNSPEKLEGSDYVFPSINAAFFVENSIYLTKHFSVTIGTRMEYINTLANGYYRAKNTDLAGNVLLDTTYKEQKSRQREFVVSSLGLSYELRSDLQLYSNFSQNYRAINFNDLRITNTNFRVDSNLTDEKGFNVDLGIRGTFKKYVSYDISLFYLKYANRIGFVLKTDPNLFNLYRYRTNISASRNIGLESTATVNWGAIFNQKKERLNVQQFVNLSLMDGRYVQSQESAIENKKVELLPAFIFKTGVVISYASISASVQISRVGKQYTDATNTEFVANAISGLIPAYTVLDGGINYTYKRIKAGLNCNNLLNASYFTKRAVGYPGPGIIASPVRMWYFNIGFRM